MDRLITYVITAVALAALLVGCAGDVETNGEAKAPAATKAASADGDGSPGDAHVHDAASGEDEAVCLAHGAPADMCFICVASLRDPNRLWCREHARYEDRCFICHPEIQDPDRLYCNEHGVYEDECFICHPEIGAAGTQDEHDHDSPMHSGAAASAGLFCQEHGVDEIECGICQPALADRLSPGEGLKIRLPSMSSAKKAHIVAQHPHQGPARSSVTAVGELGFNLNRLVHVTPLTEGIVRKVHVDLGAEVSQGDVLAELSSSQIAEAKAELLKAVAEERVSATALSRQQKLFKENVVSETELYDAEARHSTAQASLRAAERMLIDLGFDERTLESIVSAQEVKSMLPLVAPFAGTVIARHAVVGELAEVGSQLFSIADLTTLWLTLAVSAGDVGRLREGQTVEITSPTIDGAVTGEVTWISSQLNEKTRMAEVRAEVANPDARLRAGMFVDASIVIGEGTSILVPRDTVHRFGGNAFVFVRVEDDLYELRRVDTQPAGEMTAITAGLTGREMVAMEQSYLLKSEFQKSRLGAGCAD